MLTWDSVTSQTLGRQRSWNPSQTTRRCKQSQLSIRTHNFFQWHTFIYDNFFQRPCEQIAKDERLRDFSRSVCRQQRRVFKSAITQTVQTAEVISMADIVDVDKPARWEKLTVEQDRSKIKIRQTCRQFLQTDRQFCRQTYRQTCKLFRLTVRQLARDMFRIKGVISWSISFESECGRQPAESPLWPVESCVFLFCPGQPAVSYRSVCCRWDFHVVPPVELQLLRPGGCVCIFCSDSWTPVVMTTGGCVVCIYAWWDGSQ